MLLLIPGPVTTRPEVRAALAQDFAPWDNDFRPLYLGVRTRLLHIAGGRPDTHVTLALQGCGHFITEAAVRSFLPPGGKILIPATGSYADRMIRLATEAGRQVIQLPIPQTVPTDPQAVAAALAADPTISHVGLVYSETGSGVIHDVPAVGAVVRAFAVARIDRLQASADRGAGGAGSWSFDLADIYAHSLRTGGGSFRFTPPAQVLNALTTALDLFDAEGGQPARLARYTANMRVLYDGAIGLGLTPYLPRHAQGPVVVNIHAPADPAWNLQAFVDALKTRGVLISNFYNTPSPSFRVGCIGAITPTDMAHAVAAMGAALKELGIQRREAA
jgi:2-aminoethylphosphonate-pyruvate transaminase